MAGPAARLAPGLLLVAAVAAAARALHWLFGGPSEILLAIGIGIGIASLVQLPATFRPGIAFAAQRILRVGIVLLGARLSVGAIAQIGAPVALLAVGLVILVLGLGWLVGTRMGLPRTLVTLIAVGTAICGNSAIIATAPLLRAGSREVSFAVATITLFGTFALVAYPIVGRALGLDDAVFGTWIGLAINDTSQVVGAGAAYSPEARDVATVVKLIRNLAIAPVVVGIALLASRGERAQPSGDQLGGIVRALPLFVIGFVGMAALRSVGVIDAPMADGLAEVAALCVLLALAAVGLGTRVGELRSIGLRPMLLGLLLGSVLAVLAATAIWALGIGAAGV